MRVLSLLFVLSLFACGFASGSDIALIKSCESGKEYGAREVSALLGMLESKDPGVQLAALDFWATQAEAARSCLQEDLEDRDPKARLDYGELARSLSAHLEKSLTEGNPEVRSKSLWALCKLGASAASICPPVGRCGTGYSETFEYNSDRVLARHAPALLSQLRELFSDADPDVALAALDVLPEKDKKRLQPDLRQMLFSMSKLHQAIAIQYYVPTSRSDAIEAYIRVLEHADEDVAACITWRMPDVGLTYDVLRGQIESLPPKIRLSLVEGLGYQKTPESVAAVKRFLADPDLSVRCMAVIKMLQYEQPVDEALLRSIWRDGTVEGRSCAFDRLIKAKVSDWKELILSGLADRDAQVRDHVMAVAGEAYDPVFLRPMLKAVEQGAYDSWELDEALFEPVNASILTECFRSSNRNLRARATSSCANTEDRARQYLPELIRLADDKDSGVLLNVAEALCRTHDAAALPPLERIVTNANAASQVSLINGMGSCKLPSVIPFLAEYTKSPVRKVRITARWAIAQLEAEASPPRN
jgi:HEAT repeat protein